ncbi:MAG: hypothetical protein B7Z08_00230 [Sphingomonadales bacterium 32-68-7]|nr:MAG: hypothetical protein B7Z08_00230 [Sphingomonadales bacterium 32-68-7]
MRGHDGAARIAAPQAVFGDRRLRVAIGGVLLGDGLGDRRPVRLADRQRDPPGQCGFAGVHPRTQQRGRGIRLAPCQIVA